LQKVIIYGSGGQGKVAAQVLEAAGFKILGFIDDQPQNRDKKILGYPVLGGKEQLPKLEPQKTCFIIGIGDNLTRKKLFVQLKEMGFLPITALHPSAQIHRTVKIGAGTLVLPGVVVNADTLIGENCILNTTASIDHDCIIGNNVHLAPNSTLGGGVKIGDNCLIGIGSTLLPGVKIGKNAVIGGGAVVVKEVPENAVMAGVPARSLRKGKKL